ncbi:MAG: hypothetical protein QOD74_2509 [Variibacter sp.]|jgi:hypothetical protein|nr:hypothetical protein [Variibacter sp.]
MPAIKTSKLSLVVDGKNVDLKTPEKRNNDLNLSLKNAGDFKAFTADPAGFASRFGLSIDKDIAAKLASSLSKFDSLASLQAAQDKGSLVAATVWAVAVGAYSVASTKIAVAFRA